jgi:hypothetical protein
MTPDEIFYRIDFELLKDQKQNLIEIRAEIEELTQKDRDLLSGVIHLLDAIEDAQTTTKPINSY